MRFPVRWLLACILALACGCGDPAPAPAPSAAGPDLATMMDEKIAPVERGSGPLLRFIAIPGCPQCDKISGIIAQHKAGRPALKTDRYSSISPAGRKFLKEQRLGSHGVVVYDRAGDIVWRNNGHNLDEAGLAAAVQRVAP